MQTIGDRIRHIRGDTSQATLAKILGIHVNTLSRYEGNTVSPDAKIIAAMCTEFDINPEWLLLGTGTQKKVTNGEAQQTNIVSCAENTAIDIDNYCFVPMVEARLSAGTGEPVYSENIKDYYAFRKRFINYIATSTKNLVLMRVSGTSMEPEILNGGTVLIDMGRKHPKGSCYFALGFEDTIMVKELELLPEGRVMIISKNRKDYPPYEANLKSIRIIGQVIWGDRQFPI
ncbi:XRE family transcriptional regulator [Desulforegula conservatrix]|uniref:XRE family transcriptional regulator n=1 Tax=Desulforegula conservatrix TaxID=153026 RepID=UPI0006854D8A|nr:S24 family peptidase [Desulforegula conservatrix]